MNVFGYELPPAVEEKALAFIRSPGDVRVSNVKHLLIAHGVPDDAHRFKIAEWTAAELLFCEESSGFATLVRAGTWRSIQGAG
jgi:hypothetical protein